MHGDLCKHLGIDSSTDHLDRYSNLFLNAYINRHLHAEYLWQNRDVSGHLVSMLMYPGSGVVIDCIDSLSLPSLFLSLNRVLNRELSGHFLSMLRVMEC